MSIKEASTSESKYDQISVDFNYRAMKIIVFKNGEEFDKGIQVLISRRQFRHWIKFLDYLSKKLDMRGAVHKLYRIDGVEVNKFDELDTNGYYVAVTQGPFIQLEYGLAAKADDKEKLKRWNYDPKYETKGFGLLDSAESVDIYLKRCGYGSATGLPFPFDAPRSSSPAVDHKSTSPPKIPHSQVYEQVKMTNADSEPKAKTLKVESGNEEKVNNLCLPSNTEEKRKGTVESTRSKCFVSSIKSENQNHEIRKPQDHKQLQQTQQSEQCITKTNDAKIKKAETEGSSPNTESSSSNTEDLQVTNALTVNLTYTPNEEVKSHQDKTEVSVKKTENEGFKSAEVLRYTPDQIYIPLPTKSIVEVQNNSKVPITTTITTQDKSDAGKFSKKSLSIHFAANPEVIEVPRYPTVQPEKVAFRKPSWDDDYYTQIRPPRPMYYDPDFSDFDFL